MMIAWTGIIFTGLPGSPRGLARSTGAAQGTEASAEASAAAAA